MSIDWVALVEGQAMTTKTCSNCDGEGHVCRWGIHAEEVPASFRRKYPNDKPPRDRDLDGEPFECGECWGTGVIQYNESGKRVRIKP